jgi:hypothetical protein
VSRIAIIGWGSLIWDLDNLAPRVSGDWQMRGGPRLPMEFSRVSAKRGRALVVCLDPDHGAKCPTHVIASSRSTIEETARDLAARERSPLLRIGCADTVGRSHGRMPEVREAVALWCRRNHWAGAVWTDLEPNFRTRTGKAFSVANGQAYLQSLSGDSLAEAVAYIRNAPETTRTPLRDALAADPWWQGLGS